MKKLLSIIFIVALFLGIVGLNVASAQVSNVGGQTLWKMLSNSIQPVVSSWSIGSSANRVSKIWATDIDVTNFTFAGLDSSINSYIHASTTIPKTYTTNTFTGANTFNSTLTVGTLTGLLQGINGVVSASSSVSVAYGGTGATDASTARTNLGVINYTDSAVNAYVSASTTIPKTYIANTFTALQTFASGIFTTLTTNGTASSTSLFVSDNFLTVGSKKIYSDWEDLGISIAQPTTTDEVYKPMLKCLPPSSPSITVSNVYGIIASTKSRLAENKEGMTFNILIAQSPSSSTPMSMFTTAPNLYSTSSQQTYTPTGTATIPSGYCYWFTFPTASTSQIGSAGFGMTGKKN